MSPPLRPQKAVATLLSYLLHITNKLQAGSKRPGGGTCPRSVFCKLQFMGREFNIMEQNWQEQEKVDCAWQRFSIV